MVDSSYAGVVATTQPTSYQMDFYHEKCYFNKKCILTHYRYHLRRQQSNLRRANGWQQSFRQHQHWWMFGTALPNGIHYYSFIPL